MSTLTWTWPVPGYGKDSISSYFGYRNPPKEGASSDHGGIDIAAPKGTPIVAASRGIVVRSGAASGYGQWIVIDHGDKVYSIYGHMDKRHVKIGDTVTPGQLIANVASEGISSGNHLHFQIEIGGYGKGGGGTPVDPLDFVSPDSTTMLDPSTYTPSSSIVGDTPTYYGTVEAGGTTIGQRASGVTTQPVFAYVNIYVGDNKLLLSTDPQRPNVIQSFEYERLEGAGEKATFTLFDDNWDEIEAALSANFDKIYIEYGYYGTGMKSKLVRHQLQRYNLSFEFTGTVISVESVTQGIPDNLVPRSIVLNTKNPTVAVKEICRSLGYTVLDENFDESQDIIADDTFNVLEDFPITYIMNSIIPQASQENEEIFRFYLDSDNVAYFKRFKYDTTKTDQLRTYIYQKGYDSSVIDFSVDIQATFGGVGDFSVATGYRSSAFDTKTKTPFYYKADKSSATTEAAGDVTHTRSDQSVPVIETAGYSDSQVKSIVNYILKSKVHDGYKATLTIVGDPTIDYINDRYIRVINMTDAGYLHHTSGVYTILGVTDTIQGGEMTTVLHLSKSATAGNIDGVEILNPKLLIK